MKPNIREAIAKYIAAEEAFEMANLSREKAIEEAQDAKETLKDAIGGIAPNDCIALSLDDGRILLASSNNNFQVSFKLINSYVKPQD